MYAPKKRHCKTLHAQLTDYALSINRSTIFPLRLRLTISKQPRATLPRTAMVSRLWWLLFLQPFAVLRNGLTDMHGSLSSMLYLVWDAMDRQYQEEKQEHVWGFRMACSPSSPINVVRDEDGLDTVDPGKPQTVSSPLIDAWPDLKPDVACSLLIDVNAYESVASVPKKFIHSARQMTDLCQHPEIQKLHGTLIDATPHAVRLGSHASRLSSITF